MNDENNEDGILQPLKDFAEEKKDEIVSSAQEKTDDLKDRMESVTEDIENKIEEFPETVEKKLEAAEEIAEDMKETVYSEIADAKNAAEEKQAEFLGTADDIKASIHSKIDDAKEAAGERHEELLGTVEEMKDSVHTLGEEAVSQIHEETDKAADLIEGKVEELKAADMVETVQSSFNGNDDELEQVPVKIHAPKIPQYVPKQYTRDIPAAYEPSEDNDYNPRSDYDGYPTIDDVQPAPNGVKNSSGEKSSNTTLWIVLGILVVLCLIGCCLISSFFGLISVLGR